MTEMLLQQTQASRVATFVGDFFAVVPDASTAAATDLADLEAKLAVLGLHRRRAARIQASARALLTMSGEIPADLDGLTRLPGVGPYVAAAYLCVAHGQSLPTMDVNMARLLERLYGPRWLVDIRYCPHLNDTAARLVRLARDPRIFNWAVLDFAAAVCTKRNPSCGSCPLHAFCAHALVDARGGRTSGPDAVLEEFLVEMGEAHA